MKKKKHISEEQHYLCEIGLEKMPYGSSWLYKSYTEEILTHITITAYYNVGEAFLQASTAAWENLWDCRAALRKLVSSVYLESDLNLPFGKNGTPKESFSFFSRFFQILSVLCRTDTILFLEYPAKIEWVIIPYDLCNFSNIVFGVLQ